MASVIVDIKIDGKVWTRKVKAPAALVAKLYGKHAQALLVAAGIPCRIEVGPLDLEGEQ